MLLFPFALRKLQHYLSSSSRFPRSKTTDCASRAESIRGIYSVYKSSEQSNPSINLPRVPENSATARLTPEHRRAIICSYAPTPTLTAVECIKSSSHQLVFVLSMLCSDKRNLSQRKFQQCRCLAHKLSNLAGYSTWVASRKCLTDNALGSIAILSSKVGSHHCFVSARLSSRNWHTIES